jgi:hypothetical protein
MNKLLPALFFLLFLCFFQTTMANPPAFGVFYMSPEGNDANAGTIDAPVATFDAAKKLVWSFKVQHPNVPVTVYLRGGRYYLKEPVVFRSEDSGTKAGPVKYKAFPGEEPHVLGGIKLDLLWERNRNGLYQAKVPEGLVFESLFINDRPMVMARYPNYNPEIRIFNGTAADCLSPERIKNWKNPEGGYFHVIHKAHWGGFHYRITGKTSKRKVDMEGGNQNNRPENGLHPTLRYVENIYEELDTINEWYLDRKKSMLYFMPSRIVDIHSAKVEVANLSNLFTFEGSVHDPVKFITLEGITMKRTTRTFMKSTDRLLRSDWTIYRGGTVLLEGTENCQIVDCHLNQLGGNAIFVNNFNRHVTISGCHIYEVGASGICFVGDTVAVRNPNYNPYGSYTPLDKLDFEPGPKSDNYPAQCLVENNLIHFTGRVEKQTAGVQISMASEITVRHNSIYDLPRAGINIGEGAWGGHVLEFNDVFETVLETGDHGSFNSWGRDRFWRANGQMTEERVKKYPDLALLDVIHPIIIRNNRFRCDHGWDIDLDDGSSNYIVENNLCLKGGIKLREGYFRTVRNNICLNNALHPHVWYQNSGDVIRGNIWGSWYHPIQVNYWGSEVDYNLFFVTEVPEQFQQMGLDAHSVVADPLFIDPENGDFRIEPESPAHHLGFKNFNMYRFGVQIPRLKAIAREPVIPAIINRPDKKHVDIQSWLGGQIKSLKGLGEKSATGMWDETGVLIMEVPEESVMYHKGLRSNDVIIEMNGIPIKNVRQFRQELQKVDAKKEVQLTVWRDQDKHTLQLFMED